MNIYDRVKWRKGMEYHDKYFTKEEVIELFKVFEGEKTLGEVDVRNVFYSQIPAKGIAGCVIEQSVLFLKQNSIQEADIEVKQKDGTYKSTELKVTGVEVSNKQGEKYCAKEPMSITAVSIGKIEHEKFLESHFYNKIAHMIFVFYVYIRKKGEKIVSYEEYKNFPILGYKFLNLAEDSKELAKFENDWTLAHNYLLNIENDENRNELYPLLHQEIKKNLFYIDIAPRFKLKPRQTPRFRFKKSYVNTIFQEFYAEKCDKKIKKLEKLNNDFNSYVELEEKLHELTRRYKGKTVDELVNILKIQKSESNIKNDNIIQKPKYEKQITETIVVKMLGGKSKKISDIEIFNKIGMIGKTITIKKNGTETEQMKLFTMNLDEITNSTMEYEETSYYEFFSNHQLLCIIFEEPSIGAPLNDNVFIGFKRFSFDDNMINGTIKDVYKTICDKINNNNVTESYVYLKDGTQRINKTGIPMLELDFPKQKDSDIFVRGTSSDSTHRPWVFKGHAADGSDTIYSYSQQIWIKGRYITEALKKVDFI